MTITAAQRVARRKGIGASDAPIILGLSPWKTPLTLYLEKRGEIEESEQTDAQEWGELLEPAIITKAERKLGIKFKPVETLHHPKMPFIFANLDGISSTGKAIAEAKRSGRGDDYGEDGSAEVPEYVKAQVQQQMGIARARGIMVEIAFVPVLIGIRDHRVMRVPFDAKLSRNVIECSRTFWLKHVKAGKPPAPMSSEDVARRWPHPKGTLEVGEDVAMQVARAKELRDMRKRAQDDFEAAALDIKLAIAKHAALSYQGRIISTYGDEASSEIDGDALMNWLIKKHPRLVRSARRFTVTRSKRVLRIK